MKLRPDEFGALMMFLIAVINLIPTTDNITHPLWLRICDIAWPVIVGIGMLALADRMNGNPVLWAASPLIGVRIVKNVLDWRGFFQRRRRESAMRLRGE